ncbi:NAD(P)/FAD-dependent oxidoreductase [Kribbella capetownensis]|uniref:NAD(P)/FAD-dependent oxidoreductase n=1 Tax=Kribbella capetownensis TaxID=1572659 RepID=A0A4R0JE36_9ACTN|nr:NAD(P)/FAD-dependent oxidoreductase [Kribbella capetownensis]TCC45143.1 NAD(P)/FAD-dependent oxidoreductase [Kribbella capetownensis]
MIDAAVIGGSVAGLQAALTLGRARRRVVLFDDRKARNRAAEHVHNFLGVEDTAPGELLALGRRQLREYDVEVRDSRVEDVTADGDSFVVEGEQVRSVVLATGLRDELPDVPGVWDAWGRSVVACPHCHGWEVRDEPLVQLGMRGLPDRSVVRALLLSRWSHDVVLCTDGDELNGDQLAKLDKAGVTIRTERVEAVEPSDDDVRVLLKGGDTLLPRAVFVVVRQHQQSDLATELGCEMADGAVAVDSSGRTNVPGVYAVGTTAVPALFAIGAAGHASTAAVALHADLLDRDLSS